MRSGSICLALVFVIGACTTGKDDGTSSASDGLTISDTANGIAGSFGETKFTSEMVTPDRLEITVQVNGMMITALVDYKTGVMEFDGFSTAGGENTQMTDEDRASLTALEHELAGLGADLPQPLEKLRGFVATWAEFPTTVDMQYMRVSAENRSWTSLCYAKNSYYPASHDCDSGGFWTDQTTLDGVWISSTGFVGGPDGVAWYVSAGGSYQACSGSISCSRYTVSIPSAGWWTGYESDHDTRVENSYGNCFGACGAGCPGTYQFTVDCVNHDQCVRNGHVEASAYCDDQFVAASDDWASAPDCGP
jgi:hypothetical protein